MYKFKILDFSNYDGDSFDVTLDLGFDLIYHSKVRIQGVDTPELRGGTDLSKAAGHQAKLAATDFVLEAMNCGKAYFLSETYRGKFGRPLGDIVAENGDSLRAFLIQNRLGVPYHGEAKARIQDQHEANYAYLKSKGKI